MLVQFPASTIHAQTYASLNAYAYIRLRARLRIALRRVLTRGEAQKFPAPTLLPSPENSGREVRMLKVYDCDRLVSAIPDQGRLKVEFDSVIIRLCPECARALEEVLSDLTEIDDAG